MTAPAPQPPGPAPTCPGCDQPLTAVPTPSPSTTPWLCQVCARGWWNAELTAAARERYDPRRRDFGFDNGAQDIRRAALTERDTAVRQDAVRRARRTAIPQPRRDGTEV